MEKFQYLYYFEGDEVLIVESKRLDVPTSASLSDVYKWILYDKKNVEFKELHF